MIYNANYIFYNDIYFMIRYKNLKYVRIKINEVIT